jgi:hypothetical protein
MKLTFYWPNNTLQDNEFIISDYGYTQCYYNELKPADNYASLSIPWDTETANKLRSFKDDHIKVVITDDNTLPVFTGYIDSGTDFTKTQRLQPISLKLISPSFLLRQTIGENLAVKNKTVSQIVKELLTRLEIPYNGSEISNNIMILTIEEDQEYYDVIETLLFEYGYVFDFNRNGQFVVLPIFNQPPTNIGNVFDGSNIRSAVTETVNKKSYDYFKVSFSEIRINTNDLIYEDTAEKIVPKGCYFGHESEISQAQIVDSGAVGIEYASDKGELVWADVDPDNFTIKTSPSNAFTINKTGTITTDIKTYLGNKGIYWNFRAYNNSMGNAKIKEIRIVGASYTKNTAYEVVKAGNLLLEYESHYLQDRSNAANFTKNLSNYYRYSSIKLHLESYDNYEYGTFVIVRENGIGEIKARIVKKTYKLNNPINYELESIVDFTPANITSEWTWGNNNNSANRGPDIWPPTAPGNLTLALRNDGKVTGTFNFSTDEGSEVASYSIFRKTPDMPYKSVLVLYPEINSFVDESSINGMSLIYKVHATDLFGNVSNPSNEASIGTITIERPYPPISINANAFNDYITVTIIPPQLPQTNRDIYTPVEYKIQISRNGGVSFEDVVVTSNTSYDYYFNRSIDGYPEKNKLEQYRFRVFSVNSFGNLSFSTFTCNVSTGDYVTWIPTVPMLKGESTGRTLYLNWDKQKIYGNLVYRIQISKDNTNWYKPNIVDDPYTSENNWATGTINGFLETEPNTNVFYQIVPLKGQNTNLGNNRYIIEAATYYYRIAAINTDTGYQTQWTSSIQLTAEGTSAQDILKNSIGWDQIIDQSIKVSKLGVDRLIAGESTLAFIGNDSIVSNKTRNGFQYWALDNINIGGTVFKKGEFRINCDNGDFFTVDPVNGINFKASKIVMDALGSKVFGNFDIIDSKTSNKSFLNFDLIDSNGNVKSNPTIAIGYNANSTINVNGIMYVSTPSLPPLPPIS